MDHFYTIRLNKWKRISVIVVFALFAALFIWFERNGTLSILSNQTAQPAALSKGDSDENAIALTFNISWGEERVHDILDLLEKHQVQATFFISGEWAEKHPDILESISDGKHEIGMLGYRYKSYLEMEKEQIQKDLRHAKEIFRKLGYEDITLLRPPNGQFDQEILELTDQMGYDVVHWNVNPNDWENPGTEKIVNTVMKNTSNGDIILMHASDAVKQTSEAIDAILPGLKKKGFQFVPISELMSQAHAESEMIE
ncbi:putative polysaccharide deacetylase PdaB [Lentibacillus sp. JNUCC-1]|uniref:polysaccharide deacetylase family sporulation protein PdaB n=1 Tax=Lentibacillus sp. JNUCC-1 TaxID=2654513 RepID=UPI0012E716FC|nr:polysaccharide deacetylase family sporulation protein PdaB [Lentibacillus sp. JNUCC-1]MUV38133.1 putative polysaccharide deacetylase PdaB [Lentibacillus sp. JNUCC-1]